MDTLTSLRRWRLAQTILCRTRPNWLCRWRVLEPGCLPINNLDLERCVRSQGATT